MTAKSIQAFMDQVKEDKDLLNELRTKTSADEIIKVAAREGYIIDANDIGAVTGKFTDPKGNVLATDGDKTCASGYAVW
jgi:predicted ribosomally synthesized peptide with nif11-like leader